MLNVDILSTRSDKAKITRMVDRSYIFHVTCTDKKMVITCSPQIGHMFDLYSPRNDPDPEMIPKELGNGD